jgi:hypothetical protein
MTLMRRFILSFAAVGVILVFVQRSIFHLLVPYTQAGAILRPAAPITPVRILAVQLISPALFLAAIATGLWLALDSPAPQSMRKRWPWAIGTYYFLHLPLVYLPGFPLWMASLFGRWTALTYLGLSFLGFACAVWILADRFHPSLLLIVLLPVLSLHFIRQIPVSFRSGFSALTTVLVLALAGWWLQSAADHFNPATSVPD